MTLSERLILLINEGEKLENQLNGDIITGPQYEEWINDCRIILDGNFTNNALNADFIEVNKSDRRETRWGYEKMLSIIRSIKKYHDNPIDYPLPPSVVGIINTNGW